MVPFTFYLITDRHQVSPGHSLLSVLEEALEGGVRAIQLREKDIPVDKLYPLARELRQLTNRYNAKLFINQHIELAQKVDADGVHLGVGALPTVEARKILGSGKLIGVSTHCNEEILKAHEDGADFVTFGPVYATPSKAIYGRAHGLTTLADVCQGSPLPVFALGGIKFEHVAGIKATGAYGISVISAIIASPSPKTAAQRFMA